MNIKCLVASVLSVSFCITNSYKAYWLLFLAPFDKFAIRFRHKYTYSLRVRLCRKRLISISFGLWLMIFDINISSHWMNEKRKSLTRKNEWKRQKIIDLAEFASRKSESKRQKKWCHWKRTNWLNDVEKKNMSISLYSAFD